VEGYERYGGRGIKWNRVTIDGKITARVTCPGCRLTFALDHDIAEDGTVSPSLDCPVCVFHDFVKLERWINANQHKADTEDAGS
jgi:hypothetical protein